MYTPKAFSEPDVGANLDFVEQQAFGALISTGSAGPMITHLPVLIDRDRGRLCLLRAHVAKANDHHPWTIPEDERDYMDGLLSGIVAFTIDVERIDASWKLNQNHAPARRKRVIEALRESGRCDEVAIADLMQRLG